MTDYSTPSPLTKLPLRTLEHFRVSTHDAPPVPLHHHHRHKSHDDDTYVHDANAKVPCSVCEDHVSRYTCPRCGIPYCSVACYQAHSLSVVSKAGAVSSSLCTEGFYQDRVQSIVQLERKAKQQDTHAILNRTYHSQQQQHAGSSGPLMIEDGGDDDIMTEEDLVQLLELLSVLEQQEEQNHTSHGNQQLCGNEQQQQQQLSKLLAKSPKLKAAFEAAVERGDVLPLVLEPWNPWWRPVLSSSNTTSSTRSSAIVREEDNASEDCPANNTIKTLDERLLRIKPLRSLLPGGKQTNMPNLTFHLLEVLYCIAWTLRLYHGSNNATNDEETAKEAALMLLQMSSVLSHDARYDTLEQVMIQVTETSTSTSSMAKHCSDAAMHPSWTVLGHDVSFLVSNPRFIGRALLEALDIVKAAIRSFKKAQQQQQKEPAVSSQPTTTTAPELADLRRKRKKMEFFLSWSQDSRATATMPDNLSGDIRAWVEHWQPAVAEDDAGDSQEVLLDQLLSPPILPKPTAQRDQPPPLMQERTTTRKITMID